MATVGNAGEQAQFQGFTALNNQNQVAQKITMPSGGGRITRLGAWFAGYGGAATAKLCLWSAGGALLRESASFSAAARSFGLGQNDNYERDVDAYNADGGQVLYVGFATDPSESRQWGRDGEGTHYTDTATPGWPGNANFSANSGKIGAYAIYDTNRDPQQPVLRQPGNGNTLGTTPTFVFGHVDPDGDALLNYDLQVDNRTAFDSPRWDVVNGVTGVDGDEITRGYAGSSLTPGVTYYWRARTTDSHGATGPWSGIRSFSISSGPSAPTPTSPSNGATVTSLNPALKFTHNDPGGSDLATYDIQVDTETSFAVPQVLNDADSTEGVSGNQVTRIYDGIALARGTQYHWRVRTTNARGEVGPWSGPRSFSVNRLPIPTGLNPAASDFAYIWNLGTDLVAWSSTGAHAKPRLSWTFTDPDSQGQSAFQVRIYAVISGGTPVHDSGKVNSAIARSYDANWAGVRGTQYYWTLEVWDAAGESSGQYPVGTRSPFKMQWGQAIYDYAVPSGSASSSWQFSAGGVPINTQAAFLFRAATAVGGTGTVSGWVANPGALAPQSYVNVLVRLASNAPGTNPALPSMTFTSQSQTTYPLRWILSPAAGWLIDEQRRRYGSRSLRFRNTQAVDSYARSEPFSVEPGRYAVTAWLRIDVPLTGANTFVVRLLKNDATTELATVLAPPAQTITDRWYRVFGVYNVDEADLVSEAILELRYVNAAGTLLPDQVWVDGVQVEEGSVASQWKPGSVSSSAVADVSGFEVDASKGGMFRLRSGGGGYLELDQSTGSGAPLLASEDFFRVVRTTGDNLMLQGMAGTLANPGNKTFELERDGRLNWYNPSDGTLLNDLGMVIGGAGNPNLVLSSGRLEVPSIWANEGTDVRGGNQDGTVYPTGLSWFVIADNTGGLAAGWPRDDARGFVVTLRYSNSPIYQFWLKGGVTAGVELWVRNWNNAGTAWRGWVQAT